MTSFKHSGLLFVVALFSISTATAAGPPGDVQPPGSGDKKPEQAPGNILNKTGAGPLSNIPGLQNKTMPSMPELPSQASDVAKTVTRTIGDAFNSVTEMDGGLGSFLSDNMPFIGGPDKAEEPEQPVNSTNSTQ